MYIYDLNAYVASDSTLQTLMGTDPDPFAIFPLVGYESDVAPIMLYHWEPNIMSVDAYYVTVATVCYQILDDDADRATQIQQGLIDLLNRADDIQEEQISTGFKTFWTVLSRTVDQAPSQREGWYKKTAYFEVSYVAE